MERLRDFGDRWWRTFVSVAGVAVLGVMLFVAWTVVDERSYFEAEAARDRRQDAQVAHVVERLSEVIERQDAAAASGEMYLRRALSEVSILMRDSFAAHDQNVSAKLNEMLAKVAALVDRPAPTLTTTSTSSAVPAPEPRRTLAPKPAPTTTTTTSPGQSDVCRRSPRPSVCQKGK